PRRCGPCRPWSVEAIPTTWPAWSASSPPTPPRSSPANCWWSTADGSCDDRGAAPRPGHRPVSDLRPLQLGDNRVPVYYAGGDNIDHFRGAPGARSGPEDWVGSTSALPAGIPGPDFPGDPGVPR